MNLVAVKGRLGGLQIELGAEGSGLPLGRSSADPEDKPHLPGPLVGKICRAPSATGLLDLFACRGTSAA